jgi:hypothetical protein
MARHRQKDEEAGASGCGVLNTRKRMWKDADGNIVAKKPAPDKGAQPHQVHALVIHAGASLPPPSRCTGTEDSDANLPISPPVSHNPSLGHSTFDDHDSSGYPTFDTNALANTESLSPIDQQFWSSNLPPPEPSPVVQDALHDAPFEDIFNPDTASSFNNPFTTMNNYNWLFDMDLSRQTQMQPDLDDAFSSFQFDQPVNQPDQSLDLIDIAHYGSLSSHRTESLQQMSPSTQLVSPPLTDNTNVDDSLAQAHANRIHGSDAIFESRSQFRSDQTDSILERPMSMLQPSRSLPIIDELARAQMLDLIDITQPIAPDGSLVMRDNPLLSLSCLQTYCDLFFTRFNTVYPLIHISTFEPSHVDTLLLTSVLLLGATYGEKDAHQLAVRVLRNGFCKR